MTQRTITLFHAIKTLGVAAFLGSLLLAAGPASATPYFYSGVVTLCTGTCDSFASLAVGTTVSGLFEIDTTPGGSFGDADMGAFSLTLEDPGTLPSGPVGNPVTDNPLVIALGVAAANGTAGMTDAANELSDGELSLEFFVPPFNSNGAFLLFDLETGSGQLCLFFQTAGCIPGATQAVVIEGSFSTVVPEPGTGALLGSALICLGLRRRRPRVGRR